MIKSPTNHGTENGERRFLSAHSGSEWQRCFVNDNAYSVDGNAYFVDRQRYFVDRQRCFVDGNAVSWTATLFRGRQRCFVDGNAVSWTAIPVP
jgi:hypothetical protein